MMVIDAEQEKKEIINRYRRLLRKAKPILKEGDAKLIKKAFTISLEAHKDMRRKSGEPFIFHPLSVAEICTEEIGLGTTSIIAALMHDVVEDTDIELADIERIFGKKISRIIDGLTKIRGVFEYGSSQQAENFRKMLFTLSEDVRVILIKLAEYLNNEKLFFIPEISLNLRSFWICLPIAIGSRHSESKRMWRNWQPCLPEREPIALAGRRARLGTVAHHADVA